MASRFVDLLNEYEDIDIAEVDELTVTDQLILENTSNQILFGDVPQVTLNVDTSSQSTINIPSIKPQLIADVVLTEIDQTIKGNKTFNDLLTSNQLNAQYILTSKLSASQVNSSTIVPLTGTAMTVNSSGLTYIRDVSLDGTLNVNTIGPYSGSTTTITNLNSPTITATQINPTTISSLSIGGTTTLNNLQVNGTTTINNLQISTVACDTLTAESTNLAIQWNKC